jgi:broad specificity phosphatase PhoE
MQGQMDPPLSDRGYEQARGAAERFMGHRLEAVYSSDLARAWQTAEVIGGAVGMEPIAEPGLREIALGAWEGRTREEVIDDYPDLWERWAREPDWDIVPGGEGAAPFAARVDATLKRIQDRHPTGDVLCVTHGGVIQMGLMQVVGGTSRGLFPFTIQNCSLTIILRTPRRTVVTAVNDTCHLA